MLRETKKDNMEELVHALIALRTEFRRAGSVRHGNQVVATDREPGAVTEALGTYL
jgi:hypothetical protein